MLKQSVQQNDQSHLFPSLPSIFIFLFYKLSLSILQFSTAIDQEYSTCDYCNYRFTIFKLNRNKSNNRNQLSPLFSRANQMPFVESQREQTNDFLARSLLSGSGSQSVLRTRLKVVNEACIRGHSTTSERTINSQPLLLNVGGKIGGSLVYRACYTRRQRLRLVHRYTRVIITSFEITAIALINAPACIQLGDSS